MKTRAMLMLGLSAMVLGGAAIGGCAQQGATAFASTHSDSRDGKHAASEANQARKLLGKGKIDKAVAHAEAAVALRPQVATYRQLLGETYLKAGRFVSARDALADAVTLDPANGKAALHLVLAQIATGDWATARTTIDAHRDTIAVGDRGLAMALAGDPVGAVALLDVAARMPGADATVRQNLALSLALAGRWQEAKTVVSMDLAPAEVDQRIMQWAAFAKPAAASDQVATLLGVTPVQDGGQPRMLALNAAVAPAAVKAASVDAYMPGVPAPAAVVAAQEAVAAVAAPEAAPVSEVATMAARQEMVQPLLARVPIPAARAVAVKSAAAAKLASVPQKGNYFVQLGAYDNAAVAKDAWARASHRDAHLAAQKPSGMDITTRGASFYRLSVGGFARADAVQLCHGYKAKGGACFVRAGAGDAVALWARPGKQMASR